MAEVRLTSEGVKKYEERLEFLKTTARTDIAEQIKIARSFGDLSENAEYDAAKLEQGRIEYEIVDIEAMLKNVVLIDEDAIDTTIINVGNTVSVHSIDSDTDATYMIVGTAESNPFENKISNESPVGKALIGHKVGDEVDVAISDGRTRKLIVKSISK